MPFLASPRRAISIESLSGEFNLFSECGTTLLKSFALYVVLSSILPVRNPLPMQPNPRADTSRPLLLKLRFLDCRDLPSLCGSLSHQLHAIRLLLSPDIEQRWPGVVHPVRAHHRGDSLLVDLAVGYLA
jgi:hypothetical protein